MVDFGLYLGYTLLIGSVVLALVMSITNALKTPGSLMKVLYGVGGFIVLGLISFAIAGSTVTVRQEAIGITPGISRFIGGSLIMLYIVFGAAVIGLIYSEISKALK